MDYEQETYEDYYDYDHPDDYYDHRPVSYAPNVTMENVDGVYQDSSFEAINAPLPPVYNRQSASQFNEQNYDASYDAEFDDQAFYDLPMDELAQERVAGPRPSRNWEGFYAPQDSYQNQISSSNAYSEPTSHRATACASSSRPTVGRAGGASLVPTSSLPDMYRTLFSFGAFNAVQSACFAQVMQSEENMVISAPTGSGKTVLFELAIVRLLMNRKNKDMKCIYISPTKALCSEKARDWSQKFQAIGIQCCELTGDTISYGKGAWQDAKDATIIVTTPEKLDSLSRNWEDHQAVFNSIKLMCVDEVHILGEQRGSTLEACLSRMKIRAEFRFILVSATVPNASDIAAWIGAKGSNKPALCLEFGEEYRPCKLTRHVYGYHRSNPNAFQFDRTLDAKLFGILQQHCGRRPTLIFCATRKGVVAAAERIAKDYKEAQSKNSNLPWIPIRQEWSFVQQSLQDLAAVGIGVHHAGLSMEDRRLTEQRFLAGKLFVVVATSTLAVGVNLPCHTVIIKGVEMWDGTKTKEYPDLDVVQMIGRAGRPQFDKEGVAIILCDTQQRQKYLQLGTSLTTLESSLHHSLPEHLNSEIVLGAITDVQTAHDWLKNTFLFRRIQLNPAHYGIAKASPDQTWESCFDELVEDALLNLETNKLLDKSVAGGVTATAFGNIASRSYVKQASMGLIIDLPETASKRDVLWAMSQAAEFRDVRLRQGERPAYNKLCQHQDIRFEIKKVEKPHEKVFVLLQAVLGGVSLGAQEYKNSDSILAMEAVVVYKHATRLIRCFVEAAIARKAGGLLKHSLELYRSLVAKAWEDRPVVLRQLEGVGEKSIQVLATHGITTIEKISSAKPRQIETWLNRKAPFGKNIIAAANSFPRCSLKIEELEVKPSADGKSPVKLSLQITCSTEVDDSAKTKGKRASLGMTSILTCTSSSQYVDYRRIATRAILGRERVFTVSASLMKPSESVDIQMSPDDFAGVAVTASYKPNLHSSQFPIPDTRPRVKERENPVDEYVSIEEEDGMEPNVESGNSVANARPLSQAQNAGASVGHEILDNGHYACNHRCKDKTSCHHRCCQEGLAKPPTNTGNRGAVKDSKSLTEPKRPSTKQSSNEVRATMPKKPKSKAQVNQRSLLQQLDTVHNQTKTKTKFNGAPRLTMVSSHVPKNSGATTLSDDESLPDIDDLLRASNQNLDPPSNDFDFSDEEMEAAMAAIPSSALLAKKSRTRSSDETVAAPPVKRRRLVSGPSKNSRHSNHDYNPADSDIIELDSSSESSSSPKPAQSIRNSRTTFKPPTENSDTKKDIVDYPTHLFFHSSPQQPLDDVSNHSRNRNTSSVSAGDRDGYDVTAIDFQLDPNLFEGGEETLAEFAALEGVKTSILRTSPRPAIPIQPRGEAKKRSIRRGSTGERIAEQGSLKGDDAETVPLLEMLKDQESFEKFFSGVDFV